MPEKNYVFDTNVLIHDPKSIFRFQDNDIYIPIYVLEELDGLKNDPGQRGFSAREAIRILDDLRFSGKLDEGIQIHKDSEFLPEEMDVSKSGKLYVYVPDKKPELIAGLSSITDNAILQSALDIKNKFRDIFSESERKFTYTRRTILVTMDINLRVRAEGMGLQVAQYEFQSVDISNLDNDVLTLEVESEDIDNFYASKILEVNDADLSINKSVKLVFKDNHKKSALGRVVTIDGKTFIKKLNIPDHVLGIKPRNTEQKFAMDLLLDDNIKLVTLMGSAGTGKTLLTLSAGLMSVLEGRYDKLLISRPVMPLGKDIGFLPGDIESKLDPYMRPFYDNLDYIMMSGGVGKKYEVSYEELFENGTIQVEPITFIRGRSIPNQFIIIDESQNLSINELKAIITRCGENTKIVLTGDINQIDNPYISSSSNGLSVVAKKLKDNHMIAHLALRKGERSALATLAANEL